jgi:hypothetical protein
MSEVEQRLAANVVTSDNLAEFNARKLGLVDTPAKEAAAPKDETESEPEEQADQSDSDGQGNDATVEDELKERKPNPKIERRFSEITKQREQAREEARTEREARQNLEARLKELETKSNPQAQQPADELGPEPKPEEFNDMFEYAKALAEFTADKKLMERDKADADRKAAEARQTFEKAWADRVNTAKAELPDFDDMIQSSDVSVSDPVRDAIMESDTGPRILYHLAENPDFAQKLGQMTIISALREIGKLEARFEKPASKASEPEMKTTAAKSKAPAPISPIRGALSKVDGNVDADGNYHGTFQQWKEARLAKRIR